MNGTRSDQGFQRATFEARIIWALMFLPAAAEDFRTWVRSQQSTDR